MKTTTNYDDFSKGSIASHLVRLAVPMTLAQLVNVLYNIIDRMFIGRLPVDATNALTGLGVAFPICTIIIAFANLIGLGSSPLFSIERGRGNDEEAKYIMGNAFVMLVIIGFILSITGLVFKKPILYMLGASDVTYQYASSYISIYLLGNIFVMLSLGLNTFINAQGFAKTGMLTVSIGAVTNIILDPVLIFVLNLGVSGAAIATVISQFIAALWTFHFLTGKKTIIKLSPKYFKLKSHRVLSALGLGLAPFTMSFTNSLIAVINNINLAAYGGDIYIASMTVINSVREVVQMPVSGISDSAKPIISYNYGAKENKRIKTTIQYMTASLIIYSFAVTILVELFAKQMIFFFNDDPKLLEIGVKSLRLYFAAFMFMAFQFSGQTVFTALGKAKNAVFFSLFRKVFLVIPLVYLLPLLGLGVDGVFIAEPVSNIIGGLCCFIAMYFIVYRKLD
ncbi:MAG: MATE family efflux transporter [Eubacteriales bacterium]|nr:MATE family efflux transporter [Eubacteriales bacterium]